MVSDHGQIMPHVAGGLCESRTRLQVFIRQIRAVELIDLLIPVRYAHPAMIQLELALSETEGMILEPDEP